MANWIPFHDELRKGKYRGLKRGVRFVLLELSLEAKPGKGVIELPLGMNDIDAVCDILGGDRREVAEALRVFCAGDDPVVVIEGPEGARRLRIPGWERRAGFNGSRESPGASTKRTRALRERRRDADAPRAGDGGNNPGNGHVHRGNDVGNDAATEAQRPLHAVPATIGNGGATALQDRTGQDKDNPPSGGGARTRAGEPPPPAIADRGSLASEPAALAVFDVLDRSKSLRTLAGARFARNLAAHAVEAGTGGRLPLPDVLHAIRAADERETAASAAPGALPKAGRDLANYVFSFVKQTQPGESAGSRQATRPFGRSPPLRQPAPPDLAAKARANTIDISGD